MKKHVLLALSFLMGGALFAQTGTASQTENSFLSDKAAMRFSAPGTTSTALSFYTFLKGNGSFRTSRELPKSFQAVSKTHGLPPARTIRKTLPANVQTAFSYGRLSAHAAFRTANGEKTF